MANSLRAWIKQMRYTGKTTPERAERMIKALDLADEIKKLEYQPNYGFGDEYEQGYNDLLYELKKKVGAEDADR